MCAVAYGITCKVSVWGQCDDMVIVGASLQCDCHQGRATLYPCNPSDDGYSNSSVPAVCSESGADHCGRSAPESDSAADTEELL